MDTMETDEGGSPKFLLREQLLGHNAAARSACVLATGDLVTGGADSVVNRWELSETPTQPSAQATPIFDHDHAVTALTSMPPTAHPACPTGGFVTGSMDRLIRIYNTEGVMVARLEGHEHGVISLSWTADLKLISGSWDGTARVWNVQSAACETVLPGHENGVCVLGLPTGEIATGSTGVQQDQSAVGHQIRIWSGASVTRTIKDHQGPVRSLSLLPAGLGFVSASNDGTVRMRDMKGNGLCVNQHSGSEFVYCVEVIHPHDGSDGPAEFVSCSEDTCAVVWQGDREVQRIPHPHSVWAACALPNGDFATCCHDGVVRLFTRDRARAGDAGVQAAFQAEVEAAQAKRRQGPSGVEIDKLPDWDSRAQHAGQGSGDVKMFKKGMKAVAAQWSADSGTWIEVGEVMGSNDAGTVDGQSFDHVLPVEIDTPDGGLARLSLGYNNGQNPYEVAQQFIQKHQLNPDYLEQIATYIQNRVGRGAPTIGMDTGPSAAASPGAAASSATASSPQVATRPSAFKATYFRFDKPMALDKIHAKLQEFQASVPTHLALTPPELVVLSNVVGTLRQTSRWHASSFSSEEMRLVLKLLNWPVEKVFPAVDLLRLLVLHPEGAATVASSMSDVLPTSAHNFTAHASSPDCPMAVQLLTARFMANCFAHLALRNVVVADPARATQLLGTCRSMLSSTTKNVRVAAASFHHNYASLVAEAAAGHEPGIVAAVPALTTPLEGALDFAQANEAGLDDDAVCRSLHACILLLGVDKPGVEAYEWSTIKVLAQSILASGRQGAARKDLQKLMSIL